MNLKNKDRLEILSYGNKCTLFDKPNSQPRDDDASSSGTPATQAHAADTLKAPTESTHRGIRKVKFAESAIPTAQVHLAEFHDYSDEDKTTDDATKNGELLEVNKSIIDDLKTTAPDGTRPSEQKITPT